MTTFFLICNNVYFINSLLFFNNIWKRKPLQTAKLLHVLFNYKIKIKTIWKSISATKLGTTKNEA